MVAGTRQPTLLFAVPSCSLFMARAAAPDGLFQHSASQDPMNNENIRHVIDTITSKVVLILGRFTPERKAVLDALRDELRKRDYLPVLFDFQKPDSKDFTGTVITLANMARSLSLTLPNRAAWHMNWPRLFPRLLLPFRRSL
jgi:hypothetical protein